MSTHATELDRGRGLVRRLRGLHGGRTPQGLAAAIFTRLGLGDAYFSLGTAIGEVFIAYNRRGISGVMRATRRSDFEAAFRERMGRAARPAPPPPALLDAVSRRLRGDRRVRPPFDLNQLSFFERRVLRKALEIPHGEVRPYAWIAKEIGYPRAVRAVGTALARNPIPLLIPCHRVVRSDGHIGQYGLGGPATKRALLTAEGADTGDLGRLARAGVRYHGSDTTRIYCYPTCRAARRIGADHRVALRSAGQAAAAGYRPCKLCRPARAG
jgi:O-6-methylguanine DNA methyltransferase